jgi:hypothetical protein
MLVIHACVFLLFSFLEHFLQGLVIPKKERIDVSKKEQTLRRKHWGICALSRKNVIGTSKCWKEALDRGVQTPNALRRSLHEAQQIQDLQQCPILAVFKKVRFISIIRNHGSGSVVHKMMMIFLLSCWRPYILASHPPFIVVILHMLAQGLWCSPNLN